MVFKEVDDEFSEEADKRQPVKIKSKAVEKPEEQVMVVKELPVKPVRRAIDEETGIITNFVTIEEALTNLMGGKL